MASKNPRSSKSGTAAAGPDGTQDSPESLATEPRLETGEEPQVVEVEVLTGTEDPEDGEPTAITIESLEAELAEARKAAESNMDMLLRARAELDNVRKRVARDLEHAHKYGLEKLVNELLPVKDSMEMGMSAAQAEGADLDKVQEGLELTLKMLDTAFGKLGVEEIDPTDAEFNPDFHQAMTVQESDKPSGTVISVFQKGYLLNDRLIRPAMVTVAK